jgi:hypothetical protein
MDLTAAAGVEKAPNGELSAEAGPRIWFIAPLCIVTGPGSHRQMVPTGRLAVAVAVLKTRMRPIRTNNNNCMATCRLRPASMLPVEGGEDGEEEDGVVEDEAGPHEVHPSGLWAAQYEE